MTVSFSDCSWKMLVKIAQKCGFEIFNRGGHTKVKTREGRFVTLIPRHNRIKKNTAKGIVEAFKKAGCKINDR